MTDNKYTGIVELKIEGKSCKIIFDWEAIGYIQSEWPDKTLKEIDSSKIGNCCKLLAFGLRKHHPEYTEEKLKEISPPILASSAAVNSALLYAYYGAEKIEELQLLAKEKMDDSKKKTK